IVSLFRSLLGALLVHDRLHAGDVAPHFFQLRRIVQLLRCQLHAQAELGLQQLMQFLGERGLVFVSEFGCFHDLLHLLANLAHDKSRTQRQFGSGQAERFARQRLGHTVHFIQHFARTDFGDVVLGITLTVTHTNFSRLVGNRLVREDTDPDATTTLDMTGHRTTRCFDLASGDATALRCLQTELAERYGGAGLMRNAGVTAFLLFAIFSAGRLQHDYSPALSAGNSPSGFLARTRLAAGAAAPAAGACAPSARLARGARVPGLPSSRRGPRRFLSSSAGLSIVGASPLARRSPR